MLSLFLEYAAASDCKLALKVVCFCHTVQSSFILLIVKTCFIITPYKVIRKNLKTSSHSIKEMANCTQDRGKQKYRKHDARMLNNLQEEWLFKLSPFDCTFCNGPCVYKTKHLQKCIKIIVPFSFKYTIHLNTVLKNMYIKVLCVLQEVINQTFCDGTENAAWLKSRSATTSLDGHLLIQTLCIEFNLNMLIPWIPMWFS